MFKLRTYQQEAVDAVIANFILSQDPALVVAATGAGKSLIVAALAKHYGTALVLHPSKELVDQNAAKYGAYGLDNHSIFCAGLGQKSTEGDVIFASHQSLKGAIEELPEVRILIVDEAHKFTAAFKDCYHQLKERFPGLLMLGLTATPYLIGSGFIYRQDADGRTLPEEKARDPFFLRCVYEVGAELLVAQGYLCPLTVGKPDAVYDVSGLEVNASGWFTAASVEKATTSDRNATARIASQVLRELETRIAAMVFCSSIEHANDFVRHLPAGRWRLITGKTPGKVRACWLKAFKRGMFDIMVNVATLTTGVDIPICDLIAIARPTESASLWQQIAGRGMRLSPETNKKDCLILDYTENPATFFPSGNVYRPEILAVREKKTETMSITCPTCDYSNTFVKAPNELGLPVSPEGYFLDLTGKAVLDDFGEKVIAHFGRRCQHIRPDGSRCDHRFVAKKCPKCTHNNDIAARKCEACSAPLVDWNRHLKTLAARLPEKASSVGTWTLGRVDYVDVNQMSRGSQWRAVFTIQKRKKKLTKWMGGAKEALERLRAGEVPHAVAFRKNLRGWDDVRLLWSPLELDSFVERES